MTDKEYTVKVIEEYVFSVRAESEEIALKKAEEAAFWNVPESIDSFIINGQR